MFELLCTPPLPCNPLWDLTGSKHAQELLLLDLTRSLVSALLFFSGSTSGSSSFSFSSSASTSLSLCPSPQAQAQCAHLSALPGLFLSFSLLAEGRLKGFSADLGGLGLDTAGFLITLFFAFSLGAVLGAAFAFVDGFYRTEPGVAEGFSLSFSDFAGVWATIDSFGISSAMSAVDHSQYITISIQTAAESCRTIEDDIQCTVHKNCPPVSYKLLKNKPQEITHLQNKNF